MRWGQHPIGIKTLFWNKGARAIRCPPARRAPQQSTEAVAAVMDDAIQAVRRARRFDMQVLLRGSTPKYLPILG